MWLPFVPLPHYSGTYTCTSGAIIYVGPLSMWLHIFKCSSNGLFAPGAPTLMWLTHPEGSWFQQTLSVTAAIIVFASFEKNAMARSEATRPLAANEWRRSLLKWQISWWQKTQLKLSILLYYHSATRNWHVECFKCFVATRSTVNKYVLFKGSASIVVELLLSRNACF